MFCALDIHRKNINRAISDNMVGLTEQMTERKWTSSSVFSPVSAFVLANSRHLNSFRSSAWTPTTSTMAKR